MEFAGPKCQPFRDMSKTFTLSGFYNGFGSVFCSTGKPWVNTLWLFQTKYGSCVKVCFFFLNALSLLKQRWICIFEKVWPVGWDKLFVFKELILHMMKLFHFASCSVLWRGGDTTTQQTSLSNICWMKWVHGLCFMY